MKRRHAKWGLPQLFMAICMLVVAGSAFAAGEKLLHNSDNTSATYGVWGVEGGKYGKFTCTTCHNKSTNNIKLVNGTISTPNLANWSTSQALSVSVEFNNYTAFGNDYTGRTTSTRICEVCHSKTKVHRYDTTDQLTENFNHQSANLTDCTVCHSHNDAFVGKGCTSCHGSIASATQGFGPMTSGRHTAHIADPKGLGQILGCVDCHAKTVTGNTTLLSGGTHRNGFKDYSGLRAGGSNTYVASVCTATYCHSDGKAGAPAVALLGWKAGQTFTDPCNSCHAVAVSKFSNHSGHLFKGATCLMCHNNTTTTNTTVYGTKHIDGTVDLAPGGTFWSNPVSFSPSGSTCNNVSCHSPAGAQNTNSITAGVKAACNACHPTLSAGHNVHMRALSLSTDVKFYNMTANRTDGITDTDTKYGQAKTYGFGCANCHPMDSANHLNNSIDVDLKIKNADGSKISGLSTLRFLNATSITGTNAPVYKISGNKKCNNIYCHSNASRVASENAYKETPAWGGTFTGDRCAACHDNQPATGAHSAHSVGIHTFNEGAGSMIAGNIYNGTSGKVKILNATNPLNIAHGNPNNSTTIGCYICHQDTVTFNGNDKNTRCIVCHDGTIASPKGDARINNLKNHVNGSREIKFAAINVKSKAQIRSTDKAATNSFQYYSGVWQRTYRGTTYKNFSTQSFDVAKNALDTATMWHPGTAMASNCTNIACHNGNQVSWNLANFNDPNKCMDCHKKL